MPLNARHDGANTSWADPTADITALKPGQPGPGELLLRLSIARRTQLAVNLSGRSRIAGVATTGQVDFDIRRNGTGFATMRFAAASDTATFIAAAESVLEPGDLLSVVAPLTPDATLAALSFALVSTLVI